MGGGGSSKTNTEASYPPEFVPLAKGAVDQILAMQKANPLVNFTSYQPAGVAGIAPLQQFAIQHMLPSTMYSPPGMQELLDTPGRIRQTRQGGPLDLPQPTYTAFQGVSPFAGQSSGIPDLTQAMVQQGSNPGTTNLMPPQKPLPVTPPPAATPPPSTGQDAKAMTPEKQQMYLALIKAGYTPAEAANPPPWMIDAARSLMTPQPTDGATADGGGGPGGSY